MAKVLLALALLASCSNSSNSPSEDSSLTDINPQFMVTPDEVYEWHQTKDAGGGTYSGSPSWRAYLAFLEDRMQSYGVVGITRNAWRYNRWYTSDFPGNGDWTLTSDGDAIPVASYSAYSGSTGPEGIAAEMIYYDPASPPAPELLSGKIVVFRTSPHPDPPYSLLYTLFYTFTDYEYTSNPETFGPLYEPVPIDENVNADVWYQLGQTFSFNLEQTDYLSILRESQAIGGLIVFDQSFDRLAGLYQFGVPTLHQCPTLFLDRNAGNQVVEDAIQGRNATLKLTATVEEAETYQLIGYLPGRHYGTPEDEQILLVSHTDGPSISQDNGAFGLLGIVQYFSHIPQSQRPRTLFIFLDNRHYMPGMEAEFASQDWFAQHPEADDLIVASVATEHLGQLEYREIGDVYEPTGRVESSFLWVRNNQLLIDLAIEAVQANGWPRVQVKCTERLGLHDGPQGA
ncbi:MAG: hypothetical protein HZB24_02150, partial [Desulfobacterales bacterium]|nr:hypothetical protein [Desulfobacterales bacterium]